jgi:hypothetical protein
VAEDSDLDEWAVVTAALGLRASFQRCIEGYREPVPRLYVVGISAVEFVNWACALDELLWSTDTTYKNRRDRNEYGRLIPALQFVRDRHMHQVVVSSNLVFTIGFSSDDSVPPALSAAKIYWRPVEEIREPTDGLQNRRQNTPVYQARRAAYVQHLERREPPWALGHVNNFLFDEVTALGIKVPLITDVGLHFVPADHNQADTA